MTLTNQQFRKLLTDAIEERKAHDRAAIGVRLLKEGYSESYRQDPYTDDYDRNRDFRGMSDNTIRQEKISLQGYEDGLAGREMDPRYAKDGDYIIGYNEGADRRNSRDGLEEDAMSDSLREEEEIPPAPFKEVYDAVWAFFDREGFSPNQDDQDTSMRKIVTDHGWEWDDYARRCVEELEAHEQRIAAMLGIEDPLRQSGDPIT